MKKLQSSLGLGALVLIFFGLIIINSFVFDKARLDLTENQIYSISDGSKAIINKIEEPINLYFFFSQESSEGISHIRNYANRVQSLLEEYALYSEGKINLQVIDPEPFSEDEDRASAFGLTAAQVGAAGQTLYFGLGATNSLDDELTIPFFDMSKEEFLEYDISQLIYKLNDPEKVKVTILGDLPYQGAQQQPNPMNPMMPPQSTPAWVFYEQLQQLYQVTNLDVSATEIPQETDVLILAHPKGLSDELKFAIDQYVMAGKSLLAFVDPHAEVAAQSGGMGMMGGGRNASEIDDLLAGWGVEFDSSQIVLDAMKALEIRLPTGGQGKHFGYIGLGAENVDKQDVVVSSLELINGASFGAISAKEDSEFTFTPLLQSSVHSAFASADTYAFTRNPQDLQRGFASSNEAKTLAARIVGKIKSAYQDETPVEGAEHVKQTEQAKVIIVADSDLLADNFWVQRQNFFGQTILSPFANNGDLISNAAENLGGSSDLISIRARGKFSRPFDVVKELQVEAEAAFRLKQEELQARLDETEKQLQELQNNSGDANSLVLNPEQSKALEDFMKQRIEIRKELRDVQHQLNKDIDALGSWLKFFNIALIPLLLTLLLGLVSRRLMRKQIV
ncbi:ABC transporter [Saccharobesus litoralis]|uniref:ABC transporter n=1 Tax=Saccharobesus litoralis TaxID=2172099 RepID=A0A2S0VV98_9ALTE|nr:GldG family protein [Saccharobesus litoralis]AWB68103.1 ABC transporter [Saccharobesus litoralis]